MTLRVETVMMGPDTAQYAGKGQAGTALARIAERARTLENLGFDGITTPEAGHDPYLPLAVAAEHTTRVRLGTNVAIAFPRSPMVTAQCAWDLQHYSQGRFVLGIGTQIKGHNERRYSTPWPSAPGPRMREYVQCLRAIFRSFQDPKNPQYFEGKHYRFTMIPPFFNPGPIAHPDIPIQVAAVNPYMARLAGELCEGLRLHPVGTFDYTRSVLLPAIDAGLMKAGRERTDFELTGAPFLALGRDEEAVQKAKDALRQQISFYASTRSYHAVLAFHGWEEVGLELHRLSLAGKWAEMPALIRDDMLEQWAVIARFDEFADRLRERVAGLFDTVLIDLPPAAQADTDFVRETVQRLHA
ncbi:MAG: TIGR03617 family F420-dependent LLM class oxidoreductase [Gammaproteobacteria bacterium]|jgi:probable F420-dependent oxidoreductase|nr:TIGR03617 family F420-dependent LLM class oxidoreductase [Gammaproteobacteria bacterium]MBP6050278.1 TIGR03617 family F420-dependent LLM class oxidoreductase [Pseudomonadales bacterium]MBK6583803.1 TIGR03617 family F420-dependent LLM class oxidoreductase [Gammaproteobacteria bacterium]MBK7522140.1 TIGR03617 family F420-dependent LLM class oxidoreductase [Gammaproteobacteria bacterium]MBK7727387.1 TIGR03617 family F420-dependent LLM class oxidoreductase [Gammaproteobacteria bacterium]